MADTTHMPRRGFLKGAAIAAPVMALGAATAVLPAVSTATPIAQLYAEWEAEFIRLNTKSAEEDWSDERWATEWKTTGVIEERLQAERPTTFLDLALKTAALTSFGEWLDNEHSGSKEAFALLN